jgi:hypothetical protein
MSVVAVKKIHRPWANDRHVMGKTIGCAEDMMNETGN